MLRPRYWLEAVLTVARTFGVRGAVLRVLHEGRRGLGWFRAAPRHVLPTGDTDLGHVFRVSPDELRSATDPEAGLARAERVLAGSYQVYRWDWRPLPPGEAGWLEHPLTGSRAVDDVAWWRVAHLDPAFGDIKDLWEPARFAWAYDLVRGYVLTGDDRFAAAFHRRLEDFEASSPPFRGPHWACGQEVAIRAVALLYCEANLAGAASSSPEALARVWRLLAASGERVRDAIGYALSQRNNHAISEAVGLILLGSRLRGAHPEAAEWFGTGHRLLERLIREQFATDGWYIQHSFTYLRLALDQCILAERTLRAAGMALSPCAVARLGAAVDLLLAVMEPASGIVPNHGPNDGAFVHPITLAEYRDFRPVVTAASAMWRLPLPADIAADREVLAWLAVEAPAVAPARGDWLRSGRSGWVAARAGETAVFLRAGGYTSRPGHLDPLQLDVRVDGQEIVVDAGTYAYNAPAPWNNGLAGASVHNGPVVDGEEPGLRGPRFLWYRWPTARLISTSAAGGGWDLVAEVPGKARRIVRVRNRRVTVEDTVLAAGAQSAAVNWLLHPEADSTTVECDAGQLEYAGEDSLSGWFSPSYGLRVPSRFVRAVWGPCDNGTLRTVIQRGTDGGTTRGERGTREEALT